MNVLIYTYGSSEIGMGHTYRMNYLAKHLTDRGHSVKFLMPNWAAGVKKIENWGWGVKKVPVIQFEKEKIYSKVIVNDFDCIVVDALESSKEIMKFFRERSRLLISFDNKGEGRVLADILVNLLYKKVPRLKSPKIELNDFDYLILNKEFRKINLKKKIIRKRPKNLLVVQGGSDTYGKIPKILNMISNLDCNCTVLLGPAFRYEKQLMKVVSENKSKIKVVKNIKNPWDLFFNMDLAITGGGMTCFELLCTGVPCITATQEKKELETLEFLSKKGIVENLGLLENLETNTLISSLKNLLEGYERRKKMSELGKNLIDGRGIERLTYLIENNLNLRDKA